MQLRTYYTCAVLAPIVILAAVATGGGDGASSTLGLGPGASVRWLYPRSAIRDLAAALIVGSWLLWTLYRRPMAEFREAIWRAPMLMLLLLAALPLVVVLVNGLLRRMLAEQGTRIALRLLVRLIMGFGYVGLVEWVRQQLQSRDALQSNPAD
jgi:hypothetical protein